MRLIGTFNDESKARVFSAFLAQEGVANECEILTNTSWDSPDYGTRTSRIWVYEEDQSTKATEWLEQFNNNPQDPRFIPKQAQAQPVFVETPVTEQKEGVPPPTPASEQKRESFGTFTFYILAICTWLFIWSEMTTPEVTPHIPSFLPATPVYTAPIKKSLLFDYPYAYDIIDKFLMLYEGEKTQSQLEISYEGQYLLELYEHTPYWQGFYQKILDRYHNPVAGWNFNAPLFEKERDGEWWRLITPILLHNDIFHIFFNMFWLIILGNQMEKILGAWRYFVFIIITGVFSNTAQYLMGGANFIGFSGVLCAMLGFIYSRQHVAAWEPYQLPRSTIIFVALFILAMFLIQSISFFSELLANKSLSPGIANTAHLSGAFIGIILGRLNYFAWKP